MGPTLMIAVVSTEVPLGDAIGVHLGPNVFVNVLPWSPQRSLGRSKSRKLLSSELPALRTCVLRSWLVISVEVDVRW